jgi:hypothetical protein
VKVDPEPQSITYLGFVEVITKGTKNGPANGGNKDAFAMLHSRQELRNLNKNIVAILRIIWRIQPKEKKRSSSQCCQIFLIQLYQNGEKYTKGPQNVPNGP